MRQLLVIFALLPVLAVALLAADTTKPAPADTTAAITAPAPDSTAQFLVYYFHGNQRCATCRKLEAYTQEAVDSGFVEQLKVGSIKWLPTNTDDSASAHFVKDYDLYTKAVIVSQVVNGKEIRWKNLDKIWELVGDKEQFVTYIQSELKTFMSGS